MYTTQPWIALNRYLNYKIYFTLTGLSVKSPWFYISLVLTLLFMTANPYHPSSLWNWLFLNLGHVGYQTHIFLSLKLSLLYNLFIRVFLFLKITRICFTISYNFMVFIFSTFHIRIWDFCGKRAGYKNGHFYVLYLLYVLTLGHI